MIKFLHKRNFFFFIVITTQMLIYNYPYIIKIEPRTIHAWRQFDCLSFAQNYYHNNATLLQPSLNNLGHTGNGKAVSEFPIVPLIIGNIWKITGINSSIYKLFNLVILFLGLFYLYKLFLFELKDKIISTLLAGIIFTSPIISYYGVSTLSDIQAFSFSLIGLYQFSRWLKDNKSSYFSISILFFLIAGLIKASTILIFVLCIIIFICKIKLIKETNFDLKHKKQTTLYMIFPFIIWFIWFNYARNYNLQNNSEFFLVGILPIWDYDINIIKSNFHNLLYNLSPEILNHTVLILFVIGFISTLFFSNSKLNKLILIFSALIFCSFIILFFGAMDVHDYYFISPFILLIVSLLKISKSWIEKLTTNYYSILIFSLTFTLAVNSYITGIKTWKKINDNVNDSTDFMVFNEFERKNNFWIYWIDREQFEVLEKNIIPLEDLGIKKNEIVFCIGDQTINRSLFLLNRRGYTNFNVPLNQTQNFLNKHPEIKHVILLDHHLKNDSTLFNLFSQKIYELKTLSIYKVN